MSADVYDSHLHWLLVRANNAEDRQRREMQELLNDAIEKRD